VVYDVPAGELGDVAEVIGAAFGAMPDPPLEFVLQDEARAGELKQEIARMLAERTPDGAIVLASSPNMEAASIWFPPDLPYPKDSADRGPETRSFEHPETAIRLFSLLTSVAEAIDKLGTDPQWYLHLLATRPEYSRRGYATALLGHVLRIADTTAVPCSLVCPRHNVDLYRRFGFDVIAETAIIGCPHRLYSLWREACPQPAAD
jgi:GNAT superfamily N-acetyltransferase